MATNTPTALAIARPLLADLTERPFSGRVLGLFQRVCNLIDSERRIIVLALPTVGKGPFAITLAGRPGMFDSLWPGQPARANQQAVVIGAWSIGLTQAVVWEPKLNLPVEPLSPALLLDLLTPYAHWPNLTAASPMAQHLAQQAREAAAQLIEVVCRHDSSDRLIEAVTRLAGLGSGLTPAGDDYLMGLMAALWLNGRQELLPLVAQTAMPKTSALSAAFLQAAARGEFMEPWHALAEAWQGGNKQAAAAAIDRIAAFGASSGTDALAGFTHALLGLANPAISFDK